VARTTAPKVNEGERKGGEVKGRSLWSSWLSGQSRGNSWGKIKGAQKRLPNKKRGRRKGVGKKGKDVLSGGKEGNPSSGIHSLYRGHSKGGGDIITELE